jgi:putative hydrolase of the HAD superfamily
VTGSAPPPPKVLFFDAAGTLFHVKGSVADIYLGYAEKYGVKRNDETRDRMRLAFARAFQDAPPPVFAAGHPDEIKRCERLWWFDVVHNVFYRVGMFDRFDEYFEEIFEAFAGPTHWTLFPETRQVLERCRELGLELGIISNFDTRLFGVLRGLGISDLFDTVTISSLAHAAKPSPKIFHAALEKHVVDPEDAWHIGDAPEEDAAGARDAGLRPILIKRGQIYFSNSDTRVEKIDLSPFPTIGSLEELEPLIIGR